LDPEAFPDSIDVGETKLPLSYRYEPGADDDGITVTIPQVALNQVSDQRLGWLVPGLLEEKIVSMIKALPKRIRRNLVPAIDTARTVVDQLQDSVGTAPFMACLCLALSKHAETKITEQDFDQDKLAQHLHFNVRVIDDSGSAIATGRSLREICSQLNVEEASSPSGVEMFSDAELDRDRLTTFEIDELPEEVVRQRGGVRVAQFPAIIDRGDAVDVRVMSDRLTAESMTRNGLMRLYAIAERKEIRSQIRWLPELEKSRMLMAHAIPATEFERQISDLLARRAFVDGEPIVRTSQAFEVRRTERGRRIAIATQDIATWLPDLAKAIHAVRRIQETNQPRHLRHAVDDVRDQVDRLLETDFLTRAPWQWLSQYPRYFRAIEYRFDKLRSGSSERDIQWTETVRGIWKRYETASADPAREDQAKLIELRYLIEELRVSLFAQPLGTSVKVSPQRIEKMF
jgi:ATP-dependent helicase HrpA